MPSEQTGPDPARHTQRSSQRTRLSVHAHIEHGVQEREEEAQIQEQPMPRQVTLGLEAEQLADRGGEVQEDEGSEEDGPDEDGVDQDVDRVAVVRPVESEMLLKIEQPFPPHGSFLFLEKVSGFSRKVSDEDVKFSWPDIRERKAMDFVETEGRLDPPDWEIGRAHV